MGGRPVPPFARIRAPPGVVRARGAAAHDQVIPLWEKAADDIDALAIEVVEEGQGVVQPRMRVFVEGDEAILGPSLPVA